MFYLNEQLLRTCSLWYCIKLGYVCAFKACKYIINKNCVWYLNTHCICIIQSPYGKFFQSILHNLLNNVNIVSINYSTPFVDFFCL